MNDRPDILARWQRGEISGAEARRRTGARSYGDLYKWALRYDVEITFEPRDLLSAVEGGTMTDASAALGSSAADWLALKAVLKAVREAGDP